MGLDLTECTDGELAALATSGTQRAYTVLMQRYQDPIYRIVRSHVGDPDAALDVTQQSFVAAFAALNRYDSGRPLRVWLSRIAINKCRDWGRRRAVRRMVSFALPLGQAEHIAEDRAPADEALGHSRHLAAVTRAIADLPANLKSPLVLCTIDDLSQREAADVLGISEKAVETRIARARAMLIRNLSI